MIHLGGDEVVAFSWDCWNSTDSIIKYMSDNNMTLTDLYAMFETKVHGFANNYNKDVISWDEVFCTIPQVLPETAIVEVWRDNVTLVKAIQAGVY